MTYRKPAPRSWTRRQRRASEEVRATFLREFGLRLPTYIRVYVRRKA